MDAVTLIAVAQIAAFGALTYLFWQLQALRTHLLGGTGEAPAVGKPAHRPSGSPPAPAATIRAARAAYRPGGGPAAAAPDVARREAAALLSRLSELEVDVPAMARRLRKSEEEVRLMLRRQAVRQ